MRISYAFDRSSQTTFRDGGSRGYFSVSDGLLWFKHPTPTLDIVLLKCFKRFGEEQELICLFTSTIFVINIIQEEWKNIAFMLKTLNDSGMVLHLKKSSLEPTQSLIHLGFSIDFKRMTFGRTNDKVKIRQKGTRKDPQSQPNIFPENCSNFGKHRKCFDGYAFLRAFTDYMMKFVSLNRRLGCPSSRVPNHQVNCGRL